MPLFQQQIAIREELGDEQNTAVGIANLATQRLILGELAAAEHSLRRSIQLCSQIEDQFQEAIGHQEMGDLLLYRGAFGEAAGELDAAESFFRKLGETQWHSFVAAHRALRALLMGEPGAALEGARRARELADEFARTRYPVERDIIRAEWLIGAALVALAAEQKSEQSKLLPEAEPHLAEALTRCRRVNLVEVEPDILLSWARWHRAKGNSPEAGDHAREALGIADRCEYRLAQAEIQNFLARLALGQGDQPAAAARSAAAAELDG